jgi:hypothetical protein
MIRTLALTALGASLLSGCFYVEAEEPTICKTLTNQVIGPLAPFTTEFSAQYDYAFGDSLLNFGDKKVTTDIRALSLTFTLKSGASDLDFIDSGKVSLVDTDGTDPEVKILAYQRSGTVGTTLVIPAGDPVDVTKYLQSGATVAHVELSGEFPGNTQLTFDMKACLSAKVHYDYL